MHFEREIQFPAFNPSFAPRSQETLVGLGAKPVGAAADCVHSRIHSFFSQKSLSCAHQLISGDEWCLKCREVRAVFTSLSWGDAQDSWQKAGPLCSWSAGREQWEGRENTGWGRGCQPEAIPYQDQAQDSIKGHLSKFGVQKATPQARVCGLNIYDPPTPATFKR